MCLAIPMKVKSIHANIATAEVNNIDYEVNVTMMDKLKIGDYVIVHAGFAIEKMDQDEALKTLKIWQDMQNYSKRQK